jgi:hypothetical protein
MRRTRRAVITAGVAMGAALLSLGAIGADAATAASWKFSGGYSGKPACARVQSNLAGLGYSTTPCKYYTDSCTGPGGACPGPYVGWGFWYTK